MKKLEQEFVKNIGQTGNHVFKQLKAGTATNGKPIYIYSRTYQGGIHDGQIFSYETIIANTKAAGEYKLPQGTITYDEDFDELKKGFIRCWLPTKRLNCLKKGSRNWVN